MHHPHSEWLGSPLGKMHVLCHQSADDFWQRCPSFVTTKLLDIVQHLLNAKEQIVEMWPPRWMFTESGPDIDQGL